LKVELFLRRVCDCRRPISNLSNSLSKEIVAEIYRHIEIILNVDHDDRCIQILNLRYSGKKKKETTNAAIARALGISSGTISSLIEDAESRIQVSVLYDLIQKFDLDPTQTEQDLLIFLRSTTPRCVESRVTCRLNSDSKSGPGIHRGSSTYFGGRRATRGPATCYRY